MAETRGRIRVFYADGSTAEVQILGVDRLRAGRERPKAELEEQAWYRVFLAAERNGLPGTAGGFDAFMALVVDYDNLLTLEQIEVAYAEGNITAEQATAARAMVSGESGESRATLSSWQTSPCEVDSPSETY